MNFLDGRVTLFHGDSFEVLKTFPDNSVDSIVTDPPYEIGMQGRHWDRTGIAYNVELWKEVLRVLKPGGHLLAFSATKTQHRMVCAIEDAGFEIRDQIGWAYGSGFPKNLNIAKSLEAKLTTGLANPEGIRRASMADDYEPSGRGRVNYDSGGGSKMNGEAETTITTEQALEWQGWGSCLKPAWEPICMARKPLSEKNLAENVLQHRTGGLNIEGCRVPTEDNLNGGAYAKERRERHDGDENWRFKNGGGGRSSLPGDLRTALGQGMFAPGKTVGDTGFVQPTGRFPANIIHDGSDEVLALFPEKAGGGDKRGTCEGRRPGGFGDIGSDKGDGQPNATVYADSGSAARFFYCAKAGKRDRRGSKHITVKPIALMRYLARLVTPPNGVTLDPFAGSGTTGEAAFLEGFKAILIEREADHCDIAERMRQVEEENAGYPADEFIVFGKK